MGTGFEGEPQSGMAENFTERMTAAQKSIAAAIEAGEGALVGIKLAIAKVFCDNALAPDHPPYNLEGVTIMLASGRLLERTVSDATPNSQEALECWRAAIVEFPMPRRFAPAVEWALTGAFEGSEVL